MISGIVRNKFYLLEICFSGGDFSGKNRFGLDGGQGFIEAYPNGWLEGQLQSEDGKFYAFG